MNRSAGVTLIELLIAIAIVGIVFTALAQSQIMDLRSTAQQQDVTDAKASAVRTIEELSGKVLRTEQRTCTDSQTGLQAPCTHYAFSEYRTVCATATSSDARCASSPDASTAWRVQVEHGPFGEDLLLLTVTARGHRGSQYTLAQRVSCYDVYPSPSRDTPQPCPRL